MRPVRYKIILSDAEKNILKKTLKRQSTPQNIARRVKIILLAGTTQMNNTQISKEIGIYNCDVTKWTKRWNESKKVENCIERLMDKARSGKPSTITSEQWSLIMALACEKPEDHGVPITHWSHSTLTREIIKQNIVKTISQTHVGDFLKKHNYSLIGQFIG